MAADPSLGVGEAKGEEPAPLSIVLLLLLLQHVWEERSCLGVPAASSTVCVGTTLLDRLQPSNGHTLGKPGVPVTSHSSIRKWLQSQLQKLGHHAGQRQT